VKEKILPKERFLENQVAIITGSGYGIGKGIALEFARQGAMVVINDIDPERTATTNKLLQELPGKSLVVNGDINDASVREGLVEKALFEFEGLDILVNNVGIGSQQPKDRILQSNLDEWRRIWETNFLAPIALTHLCVEQMKTSRKKGKIIFITSVHQERIARDAAYSTSKAALKMLVEELAVDLAPSGIRVNGIAPGWIDTRPEATEKHQPGKHIGKTPLGRAGLPEEIGRMAVVLASDYWSSYVTGAVIPVDGGLRLFSHGMQEHPPQVFPNIPLNS
jgi:NAD(P)-dependent dehydrogenase (short-subunit alcohol dehydrogenase family)